MDKLISFFLMIIISTSLTVPGQPSSRFHVEDWLPFRNLERAIDIIPAFVRDMENVERHWISAWKIMEF